MALEKALVPRVEYFDITFPTPGENLSWDEKLLLMRESGDICDILRVWEPGGYFVVLGRGSKAEEEVNLAACRAAGVPVLRRCSGGGTVLQGPGCLNYSLILNIPTRGPLCGISSTAQFILRRHVRALEPIIGHGIDIKGTADLALNDRKFSGNAQRRTLRAVLFHGTFLLNLDLSLVSEVLAVPAKAPAYRRSRSHEQFMTNLGIPPEEIANTLKSAWNAR